MLGPITIRDYNSFGVIAYDDETKKLNYYHLESMARVSGSDTRLEHQ